MKGGSAFAMTSEEYKKLSPQELAQAAVKFDDKNA